MLGSRPTEPRKRGIGIGYTQREVHVEFFNRGASRPDIFARLSSIC